MEKHTCQIPFLVHVAVDTHILNDESFRYYRGLKALCTIPSHIPKFFYLSNSGMPKMNTKCVLDRDSGTFGDEDEVLEKAQRALHGIDRSRTARP
jgi:hypothetical protein